MSLEQSKLALKILSRLTCKNCKFGSIVITHAALSLYSYLLLLDRDYVHQDMWVSITRRGSDVCLWFSNYLLSAFTVSRYCSQNTWHVYCWKSTTSFDRKKFQSLDDTIGFFSKWSICRKCAKVRKTNVIITMNSQNYFGGFATNLLQSSSILSSR